MRPETFPASQKKLNSYRTAEGAEPQCKGRRQVRLQAAFVTIPMTGDPVEDAPCSQIKYETRKRHVGIDEEKYGNNKKNELNQQLSALNFSL